MDKRAVTNQQVKDILIKQMQKIKKWYQRYKNNPYQPKNIHQLRVHLRKLRSLLNFIKPLIEDKSYQLLNENLKEIAKQLSPVREVDVLLKECNKIAKAQPQLTEHYADLFHFLEKSRLNLIKRVSTKKAFSYFEDLIQETEIILDDLSFDLGSVSTDDLTTFFENRFIHKKEKLEKSFKNMEKDNYENVHDIRKQAKKIRYVAEVFKKWLPGSTRKELARKAKELQDDLGEYTDAYVNLQMFKDYKMKTNSEKLIEAFDQLNDYYS